MAAYALHAFLDMFFMALAAFPGLTVMALVAELTLSLDQTGRFTGVTAGARQFLIPGPGMLFMGLLPGKIFRFMAKGTGFYLGR